MLLDSFHPIRSKRYHTRREAFIRKYKSTTTPARYARSLAEGKKDEEDLPSFDDAEGWVRGEEWGWVGMDVPTSLSTSERTRVDLYPDESGVSGEMGRKGSQDSDASGLSSPSTARTALSEVGEPITPMKEDEDLPIVSGLDMEDGVQKGKGKKMGMQGFKGGDVEDSVKGTKGDVMFHCLYQASA